MYIVSAQVRGFRDLPSATITDCARLMRLAGPGPTTTALGDAIELGFAALSHDGLHRLARRWGLVPEQLPPDDTEPGFPDALDWCDPIAAKAIVDPAAGRALRVELELHLDPPLFGQLRDLAGREPRVVTALATRPTIRLSVGALFTSTYDALAVHLQGFSVGEQAFPVHGKERPAWLDRFLRGLRGRFHRFDLSDDAPAQLLEAATSREAHASYLRWQAALGPEGPALRVARGVGDLPMVLGDDLPMRRFGQAGLDRAMLAAAIHLSGADIVWAESDDPMLHDAVRTDPSPLEQVFSVGPSGDVDVQPHAPPPENALRSRRAWGSPRP